MQNLDEKIDSLLYGSLLEQDKRLSKVKIKHDETARILGKHLEIDGKPHGINIDGLKYLISFFVEDHQDEAALAGRVLSLKEEDNPEGYLGRQPKRVKILRNLITQSAREGEDFEYEGLRKYLDPAFSDGIVNLSGFDKAVYNWKKLIWAAKKIGFYKKYNIGDFEPEAAQESEASPGPEESKQELSSEDKEEVIGYMDKTVHLIALQTILDGQRRPLPKYGKLIRKYFIATPKRRKDSKRTLAEELLEKEEDKSEPNRDRGETEKEDTLKLIKQLLYDEAPPTPEQAKKSYESFLKVIGISSERDPSSVLNQRIKSEKPELADDRYDELLQTIKFLIYIDAGVEKNRANEMSKNNPFINMLQEDGLRPRVLNLDNFKKQNLDEGMLGLFGAWVEYALKGIFGGWGSNLKIVGSKRDVESFARTLSGEARYIEAAKRYGLDHPTTYKNKSSLEVAVRNFEKDTGIKWPFK